MADNGQEIILRGTGFLRLSACQIGLLPCLLSLAQGFLLSGFGTLAVRDVPGDLRCTDDESGRIADR